VKEEVGKTAAVKMRVWQAAILVGIGLGGLVWGADLMVESAVAMAREFGVSEWLIGLTIVAIGTSLPELAATGAAAWKGESDIALGNILGSNVFNILLILGVTVVVNPMRVNDSVLFREMPAMVLFAGLLLPILWNGLKVYRWEGCVLLAVYVLFVGWQVSTAK
jgi:cation:H+ antiporter